MPETTCRSCGLTWPGKVHTCPHCGQICTNETTGKCRSNKRHHPIDISVRKNTAAKRIGAKRSCE